MVTPFDLVIPLLGRLGKVSKLERKKLQEILITTHPITASIRDYQWPVLVGGMRRISNYGCQLLHGH